MKSALFIDFHSNLKRVQRITDMKGQPFLSKCIAVSVEEYIQGMLHVILHVLTPNTL